MFTEPSLAKGEEKRTIRRKYMHIDLHCQKGSSDKVYHCAVVKQEDGYAVIFAYGRRGSTLTRGTKTPEPASYEKAVSVYYRLVAEKK
jgi:bifunctional non-homologous end joining protein LigD